MRRLTRASQLFANMRKEKTKTRASQPFATMRKEKTKTKETHNWNLEIILFCSPETECGS